VLAFGAQQRKLLLQMQFDFCLNIVNYFTHHHAAKAIEVVAKYYTNMGIPSNSSLSEE
jgi:hypothetical protein